MKTVKRIGLVAAAIALVIAVVIALLPEPTPVDMAVVTRGALVVTVDGEGRTRVQDRYVVAAPVAGHAPRLTLQPGDRVDENATLVEIAPFDPPLLDVRSRAQAAAQASAARAAVAQARARVAQAEAAHARAQAELARTRRLVEIGALAQVELEEAEFAERAAAAELESARFGARVAQFELETAQAALRADGAAPAGERAAAVVRAPVRGTVLRVLQESAGPVAAGAPLLEIGDTNALEVVVELLSTDAVEVEPGAEAWIERWGGDEALGARVRRVEPSGFTKVSALGLEEQRVNVIVDFTGPREARRALGDGFRVFGRIVVARREDALRVPQSALFRRGERWAVFVEEEGRARVREVEIGRQSEGVAEVLSGLGEGERVVVHPGDRLEEGGRIKAR